MERTRILSIVDANWGKATIYTDEHEPQEVEASDSAFELKKKRLAEMGQSRADFQSRQSLNLAAITDDESSSQFKRLSPVVSSLCAAVMEVTMQRLGTLDNVNNEMRVYKTMYDIDKLKAIKYGVKQPLFTDYLEGIDPHNLSCTKYKIQKLCADRNYIRDNMIELCLELALDQNYDSIEDTVNGILNRNFHYKYLIEQVAKNKIISRDLCKKLRQRRNHIKTVIYDTNAQIVKLNSQVEDVAVNAECRSRYVDKWQRARTEQNTQSIKDWEYGPSTNIEYYKARCGHEQRVHSEVDLLFNIMITETMDKVENWMKKYDNDMEQIDLKIQIKKNEYQNQRDKRIELEETIKLHDKLMKDWTHFKQEREKARQYRDKMTKSAITVQAWWRGLLVRLQLGPYKVAKKRGGSKKK